MFHYRSDVAVKMTVKILFHFMKNKIQILSFFYVQFSKWLDFFIFSSQNEILFL